MRQKEVKLIIGAPQERLKYPSNSDCSKLEFPEIYYVLISAGRLGLYNKLNFFMDSNIIVIMSL